MRAATCSPRHLALWEAASHWSDFASPFSTRDTCKRENNLIALEVDSKEKKNKKYRKHTIFSSSSSCSLLFWWEEASWSSLAASSVAFMSTSFVKSSSKTTLNLFGLLSTNIEDRENTDFGKLVQFVLSLLLQSAQIYVHTCVVFRVELECDLVRGWVEVNYGSVLKEFKKLNDNKIVNKKQASCSK